MYAELTNMLKAFDYAVLDWFQSIHNPVLTVLFRVFTVLGEAGTIWLLLSIVLIVNRNTRHIGITVVIALLLSLLVCNGIIKNLVARPRPFALHPEIELLIKRPGEYSFPSGHTCSSFCAASAILAWKKWRVGIPAVFIAIIISASRLYFYVHFPTDVLAGIVLGCILGWTAYLITKCLYHLDIWTSRGRIIK